MQLEPWQAFLVLATFALVFFGSFRLSRLADGAILGFFSTLQNRVPSRKDGRPFPLAYGTLSILALLVIFEGAGATLRQDWGSTLLNLLSLGFSYLLFLMVEPSDRIKQLLMDSAFAKARVMSSGFSLGVFAFAFACPGSAAQKSHFVGHLFLSGEMALLAATLYFVSSSGEYAGEGDLSSLQ